MKIITGRTGEEHVTPIQDAMWHRGMTGESSGVFGTGSKFFPTKISNNVVRIADGCLSIQGRFLIIEPKTYDEVSIANGAQGRSRIDIICARLFVDKSQDPPTTDADFYVFQGDEAQTDPVPPTIPTGDLDGEDTEVFYPLVQVNITGVDITSVEMIGNILNIGGVLDEELSESSHNAVQNRAIYRAINTIITTFEELLQRL